jgi:tetratricopeptide (TPR) repeat protein
MVNNLLASYVDESADLEMAREAVRYLLDRLNSREQREKLLEDLLQNLGGKNAALDSELATLLGLLMAEKADLENAQLHLMNAFNSNKYNKLAFAKLAELVPEQIGPTMYLEHLRLALGKNPADIEAALAFAQYAQRLQLYDTAANAYEYCNELFSYLYPAQSLPAYIYLPWMITNYNTQRNQHKCLQIASDFRQSGQFDLFLEAIAGKAAAKVGNDEQASRILQAAESKALQLVKHKPLNINYAQLAWFYCFASPDADKAINRANKAYSIEPDSPTAAAILAYAFVMNGQTDWAKTLIDNYQQTQIADLTLAQIQLSQEQRDSAIETLKSAIDQDPGSLEAERAKELLAQNGGEYIPPIDPDITLMTLRNSFGQAIVPAFTPPEKIISVQLNARGSKFSYGSKFGASVAITNNSSEPLVISNDGLFTGNIRVDADISGDLNKKIPNLASVKISPASHVKPGQSIFIPIRLLTAELRHLLLTYPQASVDIEFTVYLDPVTTAEGKIANRLHSIKPAKVVVKRPGVELTGKFLRNRYSSLTKGRQGQKIKTAKLFTGLLAEQHAMANREPLYKFIYADWMPALLKSALIHNLTSDDWVAKVHTMAGMLSLQPDFELIDALAENLNDTHWPVRMTAVFLLARNQGSNFNHVLDWTAKYDSNNLVRDMAITLGATPQQQEQLQISANKQ